MTSVKTEGPEVLAVFLADVKATCGKGSTVALVQGGSGKCRLYGRNALAHAFPEQEAICKTLSDGKAMAEHFKVKLVSGKAACDKFLSEGKLAFEGTEAVLGDKGQVNRAKGGRRAMEFAAFSLGLLLLTGCKVVASAEGVLWQGITGGYFVAF